MAIEDSRQSARPVATQLQPSRDEQESIAPVPLLYRSGEAVLNSDYEPMMRPAKLPPEFFVSQGHKDKQTEDNLVASGSEGSGAVALGYEMSALANFRRGGPWDAQRVGGSFHKEFVDYSTVAIGLYAAASGMTRNEILTIEDMIARSSHYPLDKPMDSVYKHLPEINVRNTDLGYLLYSTGQVSGGH